MAWVLTNVTTAVNLTAETDAQSVTVAHRAYAETSRLTARIIDEAGTLTIATEHEVSLVDGATTIFAGYVRVCKKLDRGVSSQRVYEIEAQDYTTALGDDVVDGAAGLRANGESDKARIAALGAAFGTRGVNYNTASVVQLRAVMPDQDFTGLNLHQALSAICKITGGSFYVDFLKVLHYFNSEALAAPFNLSDAPNGSTTFGYDEFSLTDDTVQYANAVYVIGTDIADWRPSAAAVAGFRAAGTLRAVTVNNPEVVDATSLAAVGDALLAQYGAVRKPSSLITYQPGLRAGMTVQITHAGWGVAAVTYRIASMEAVPVDANRIRYQIFFGSNPISIGDLLRQNSMSVAEAYLAGAGAADAAVAQVLDLSAGGGNLVPNSSFEDQTSWTPGAPWAIGVTALDAFHGKKEAKVIAAGTDPSLMSPFITVDRLATYWASAWIWCRAFTSGRMRFQLLEYNAAGTLLATTVIGGDNAGVTSGWVRVGRKFSNVAAIGVTVWQPTTTKVIVAFSANGGTATGTWSLDGVQLERADLISAYAPKPQEIVDGSITTTQIADNAITTPKLTSGAVVAGKIAAGAVTAETLAAQAVTAASIAAGAITADKLAALLILASTIKTAASGKRVEIDEDGIRLLDASEGLLVRIPTNTDPVYVSGQVEASSLVSVLTAELRGATTITAGGDVILQVGVQNPTSAPVVTQSVPYLSLSASPAQPGSGICYDPAGGSGGATPSYWIGADPTIGNLLDLAYEYNASTGALIRTLRKTGTTSSATTTVGSTSHVSDTAQADAFTGAQVATPLTIPSGLDNPRITKVAFRCTGYNGGTPTIRGGVWSNGNTKLGETVTQVLTSEAFNNGASNLYNLNMTSELAVTPGSTYRVGWFRSSAEGFQWDQDQGSGKTQYVGQGGSGNLSSISTDTSAKPNVYITVEYDVDAALEGVVGKIVGVARQGTFIWVLDSNGWLFKYNQADLSYVGKFDLSTRVTGTKGNAGLFFDGTNLIITTATGVTGTDQIRFVRVSTAGAFVSNLDGTGLALSGLSATTRGGWLASGFYHATVNGIVETWSSTTGAWADNRFGAAAEASGGVSPGPSGWGAAWSATNASRVWLYTTWNTGTSPQTYWIGYTWYDITGTTHETQISPRTSISITRRRQLTITTPAIPTAGTEPADRVRVYMVASAGDPGGTGYKLQATDTLTARTLQTYNAAGAANPGSNSFPAGTPAEIASASAGWALRGDGTMSGILRTGSGDSLRVQTGVVNVTWSAAALPTAAAVTFPVAFSATPIVTLTPSGSTTAQNVSAALISVTSTGFTCGGREVRETAMSATIPFQWIAIGPA